MPYIIEAHCPACDEQDTFQIGDWISHLGVYLCQQCQKPVNIPVETGQCPGCHTQPAPADYYDYARSIPYLGGKMPFELQPGPTCLRCTKAPLQFTNTTHLNMGMIVHNGDAARLLWGQDYMEKALFMNSCVPVMQEFGFDPIKTFQYFHLHIPTSPLITRSVSFPLVMDIRTHLMIASRISPDQFIGRTPQNYN